MCTCHCRLRAMHGLLYIARRQQILAIRHKVLKYRPSLLQYEAPTIHSCRGSSAGAVCGGGAAAGVCSSRQTVTDRSAAERDLPASCGVTCSSCPRHVVLSTGGQDRAFKTSCAARSLLTCGCPCLQLRQTLFHRRHRPRQRRSQIHSCCSWRRSLRWMTLKERAAPVASAAAA